MEKDSSNTRRRTCFLVCKLKNIWMSFTWFILLYTFKDCCVKTQVRHGEVSRRINLNDIGNINNGSEVSIKERQNDNRNSMKNRERNAGSWECSGSELFPWEAFLTQPDSSKVYLRVDRVGAGPLSSAGLTKFLTVFGILILGEEGVSNRQLLHVGNCLAELLDSSRSGRPASNSLIDLMRARHAALVFATSDMRLDTILMHLPGEYECVFYLVGDTAAKVVPGGPIEPDCKYDVNKNYLLSLAYDRSVAVIADFVVQTGYPLAYPQDSHLGQLLKEAFNKAIANNWLDVKKLQNHYDTSLSSSPSNSRQRQLQTYVKLTEDPESKDQLQNDDPIVNVQVQSERQPNSEVQVHLSSPLQLQVGVQWSRNLIQEWQPSNIKDKLDIQDKKQIWQQRILQEYGGSAFYNLPGESRSSENYYYDDSINRFDYSSHSAATTGQSSTFNYSGPNSAFQQSSLNTSPLPVYVNSQISVPVYSSNNADSLNEVEQVCDIYCQEIAFQSWALISALGVLPCSCRAAGIWKLCTPEEMRDADAQLYGALTQGISRPTGYYWSSSVVQ